MDGTGLSALTTLASEVLTVASRFDRLAGLSPPVDPDVENGVRVATEELVSSLRRLSDLLNDGDHLTAIREASGDPVTLAGTTRESVVEIVEEVGWSLLFAVAGPADKLLTRQAAVDQKRLFSLDPAAVVRSWTAVRSAIPKHDQRDLDLLEVALRKESLRAERLAPRQQAAEPEVVQSPPDELLAKLSKQQERMVKFVWGKPAVARHKFEAHVWKGTKIPEKKTVERQVQRLNDDLIELRAGYEISINDRYVKFGQLSAK